MLRFFNYKLISTYRTQIMGISILWIMLYHIPGNISLPFLSFIKKIGYGGVDIFLLLSGMGLYFAYKKVSIVDFYKKRLMRVLPTYFPAVAFYCLVFWLFGKMSTQNLIMNMTGLSFWFNTSQRFDWYIPSLMFLYLIAPFIFRLYQLMDRLSATITIMVLAILTSILITSTPLNYLLIFTIRIPVFLLGLMLGYWIETGKTTTTLHLSFHLLAFIAGIIILNTLLVSFDRKVMWDYGLYWYPFILITLPLSMLLGSIIQYIAVNLGYKLTFLNFCGEHSLEIYLVHLIIFLFAKILLWHVSLGKVWIFMFYIFCIILSLFLASVLKRTVTFVVSKFMGYSILR